MKSRTSNSHRASWRTAALVLLPLVLMLAVDRLIAPHYRLAVNESESLPGTLFLVRVGNSPACGPVTGEHVQLQMSADARWYAGARLLKVAKGCPGDVVRIVGRDIYLNDWFAGRAVAALKDGTPMEPLAAGVIPAGHYYMWASHPASFDSRYAEFNLIAREQIIGTARRLF